MSHIIMKPVDYFAISERLGGSNNDNFINYEVGPFEIRVSG
jgi:hypothetical protein